MYTSDNGWECLGVSYCGSETSDTLEQDRMFTSIFFPYCNISSTSSRGLAIICCTNFFSVFPGVFATEDY